MRGWSARMWQYHSKLKANSAKCSKYHAKCQVTMPKCSKYHAKWQFLVPNCCKHKANGTRKESQKKNPNLTQKKKQKHAKLFGTHGRTSATAEATLLGKTQGFARECFHLWIHARLNSFMSQLLDWWCVVDMMMWLTWWCGWHDDVADMMAGMLTMAVVRNTEVFFTFCQCVYIYTLLVCNYFVKRIKEDIWLQKKYIHTYIYIYIYMCKIILFIYVFLGLKVLFFYFSVYLCIYSFYFFMLFIYFLFYSFTVLFLFVFQHLINVFTHACIIYIYIYIFEYTYTYTYIHACIHTYISLVQHT